MPADKPIFNSSYHFERQGFIPSQLAGESPYKILTQECVDKVDGMPIACTNVCLSPAIKPFKPCDEYVKGATDCLNKLNLSCAADTIWSGPILWEFFSKKHTTLQVLGLPNDIKTATHEIYLASIANCLPRLMDDTYELLFRAISGNKLDEIVKFVRTTDTNKLPFPKDMMFNPKFKNASLLLIFLFGRTFPGRSPQEYLMMSAHYFPLIPKPREP